MYKFIERSVDIEKFLLYEMYPYLTGVFFRCLVLVYNYFIWSMIQRGSDTSFTVQSKDKTHKPIVYGKDKYIHSQSLF
jgi:hypothetical protein